MSDTNISWYIFDIDGTLCNLEHRLHFIQTKPADWDNFFDACDGDCPIPEVVDVAKALEAAGHRLALITGRAERSREKTLRWFKDRDLLLWHELWMRKDGDHRQDNIVKGELLDEMLKGVSISDIRGVFEDRQQVVDMYRERGLRVFQVAKGDF